MSYEIYTPYSFLRNRDKTIFENFEEIVTYFSYEIFCYNDFAETVRIIDCYDRQRVDPEILKPIYDRIRNERWERYYKNRYGNYVFRSGPVKRTGKKRYGHWYRHPKTLQQKKYETGIDTDQDVKYFNIRTRGKAKQLPSSWDDVNRSDHRNRNWKRHRDKQYKIKSS